MGKNIKTKPSYNHDVLKIIKRRYGYSFDYLRKLIRGDRNNIMADVIKAEYNKLNNESLKALEDQVRRFEN
jgi:hypothetical protein